MNERLLRWSPRLALIDLASMFSNCGGVHSKDPAAEAPPKTTVVSGLDVKLFKIDHPEQFPLVVATEHASASELAVTGTVAPDISRSVPVISLVPAGW